mgnify:FL=1
MFFEGLDCVEVVLVVGFKPGMVSLEGVRAEVGVGCRADEGVDLVHHCVACGNRLRELGLEGVRITELVEGGAQALKAKPKGRLKGSGVGAVLPTREEELEERVRKLEAQVAYLKKSIALKAQRCSQTGTKP